MNSVYQALCSLHKGMEVRLVSLTPLSCPPNVPSLQETGSINTNELETGLLQLISREGYCKFHKVSNISQGYCLKIEARSPITFETNVYPLLFNSAVVLLSRLRCHCANNMAKTLTVELITQ